MRLREYRCRGTYRGKPCGKLMFRGQARIEAEAVCERCKARNLFHYDGTVTVEKGVEKQR